MLDHDDDSVLDLSEQTQRPRDVALNQQRINAWHPNLDPVWVIVALFMLGVILVPVGVSRMHEFSSNSSRSSQWSLLGDGVSLTNSSFLSRLLEQDSKLTRFKRMWWK